MEKLKQVTKAIAAGAGGAISTAIVTTTVIPPDVPAPWWGYVIAYGVGTLLPMLVTYKAPANKP